MVRKASSDDDYEQGNWNVAASYVELIMFWITEADKYTTIAEFGDMDFETTFYMKAEVKLLRKLEALRRLAHSIEMLLGNTKFAVLTKDRENINSLQKDLTKIKESIPKNLIMDDEGNITTSEELLSHIHQDLKNIKETIKIPLNNAELIFKQEEEPFDPVEWKKKVKERFVNVG